MADDFNSETEVVPAYNRYPNCRKRHTFYPDDGNKFSVLGVVVTPANAAAVNDLFAQAKALSVESKQLNGTSDPDADCRTSVNIRVTVLPNASLEVLE